MKEETTSTSEKQDATPPLKIEVKTVKHEFDGDERARIGGDLARAIAKHRGIEAEFDQVKASYKAKTVEAETLIDRLSTDLMNGFEMRQKKCVVVYRARDKKKDFILEEDWNEFGMEAQPALTEDMTPADFQAELFQAESKFNHRAEIELFPRANNDFATLVVGEFKGKWFAALRASVGIHKLDERLDSEQACCKERYDMVKRSAKRFAEWLTERLGKDNAKGFQGPVEKAVLAEKERVE